MNIESKNKITFSFGILTVNTLILDGMPEVVYFTTCILLFVYLNLKEPQQCNNAIESRSYIYRSTFMKQNTKKPRYSEDKDDILQIDFVKLTATPFPVCSKCNTKMKIKTACYGDHRGSRFWGCEKFPKCDGPMLHLYNRSQLILDN